MTKKIALFSPSLAGGGSERVVINLARGLLDRGLQVDIVLSAATGSLMDDVDARANLIDLASGRVSSSLHSLCRYLRHSAPDAMLSTMVHANVIAVLAKIVSRVQTRLILRDTFSAAGARPRPSIFDVRVAVVSWLAGKLYRQADGVVAICNEMRSEISTVRKISLDQIQVIYNPILISEIRRKGKESSGHEWCDKATAPIVLAVGRLQRQKDFATLLRAFQLVRLRQNAKLIIVGEGKQREFLEKLARDLNIQEDVDMPGFSANPYAYMARASVYVLSSLFEGLPNALLEALAIGVPIVSTDCKTGPGEILRGGLDGHLVPVQDHVTMARVIEECLRSPNRGLPSKESLERFELRSVTSQYLKLLLPDESFT